MNPQFIIRKKSLSTVHSKPEIEFHSPYLKPPLSTKASVLPQLRNKRKIKTLGCLSGSMSISSLSSNELNHPGSSSPSIKFHSDIEYCSDSEMIENDQASDNLIHQMQEKLNSIPQNDFKSVIQTYLIFFNKIIETDSKHSKILSIIKHGLINSIKNRYKYKIQIKKEKSIKESNLIDTLSKEKESLISKLNILSSQNINLMTSNETLIEKFKKFQETIDNESQMQRKRSSLLEDLNTKDEKIRELQEKLEEMYTHENKLLQIIEKFNIPGLDIESLYHGTAVRRNLFEKKRKQPVPSINLTFLEND